MGVGRKRKGRGGMAQILLHGLDVVSGPEAVDRERVPKIMEPELRHPKRSDDAFKVDPEGFVVDIPSQLVGKDKVLPVIPCRSGKISPGLLPALLLAQGVHDSVCRSQYPGPAVLQRRKPEVLLSLGPVMLLVDQERSPLKVYAIPGQAEKLSLPEARKQGDEQRKLIYADMSRIT